jgi:Ser/Thr protein kinase RdoA (MazF antagonist)
MPASSTRLWALDTSAGRQVVKEFPYHDGDRPAGLAIAAEHEDDVWRSGTVLMPEPVRAVDGRLVPFLVGADGAEVPIRMHRWLTGSVVPAPASADVAGQAGEVLARIHGAGSVRARPPRAGLHWWTEDPAEVLRSLANAGMLSAALRQRGTSCLGRSEKILIAGERLAGDWVYTHCDHKPANSLLVGSRVAVLDWDECGYCLPRLEVAESALRWAGAEQAEPDAAVARAFLRGYECDSGGRLGPFGPEDFGKWVAALVFWLWFSGRRAAGEFGGTAAERLRAATTVADTIGVLDRTLSSIGRWAEEFSGR